MKKYVNNLISGVLTLTVFTSLAGCGQTSPSAEETHKQLFAMDTIMTLTAYGENGQAGIDAATTEITTLAAMLDPQDAKSTVYAMNNAQGAAVEVPSQITDMLAAAAKVYGQTGGALDLSVYPLSKLWGFIDLEQTGEGYVPTQAEIDECLKKLCFDKITVSDGSVTMPSGAEVSFGAVAKGYASDKVMEAMSAAGVANAVISLGGNVQTMGTKPDGSKWTVGVENPNDTSSYIGTLSVGQTAVVTSGSYQRYFEKDGKTYHHILDPHTGYPADSGLKSVTILCSSGVTADCLSTAMFVLGTDKALEYWRTYGGFEMLMITTDDEIICTSGLQGVFTPTNSSSAVTYEK